MPVPYKPGAPPRDEGRLRPWVADELEKISTAFAAPVVKDWGEMPSSGMLAIALADINKVTLTRDVDVMAFDPTSVPDGTRARVIVRQDPAGQHRVNAWQNVEWLDADPSLGGAANEDAYFELFFSEGRWLGWSLAVTTFVTSAGAATNLGGDFSVRNDKFVVSAETGDTRIAGALTVAGTTYFDGQVAIDGEAYSHCVMSIGFRGRSPLSQPHQVAAYSALTGNSYVADPDGFVAGFETALNADCGGLCNAVTSFQQAAVGAGVGTTIRYVRGFGTYDDHVALNNAAIADNSSPFTGNWFIHYPNARPSLLGGNLTVGGDLDIKPGHDLILPGGGMGISNLSSRFMTVAAGPAPRTTFNFAVTIKGDVSLGSTTAQDVSVQGKLAVSGDVRWSNGTGFGLMGSDANRFLSYVPSSGIALNTNGHPLTVYEPSWRLSVGNAGQASPPPDQPAGYLDIVVNGLNCAIPLYFRGT